MIKLENFIKIHPFLMKDKNLYLFDLDGVIIDSKKNMKISWNSVNKNYSLKIPFKKYFF